MAEDLDDFIYMDEGELMELANEQNQQDTAAKRLQEQANALHRSQAAVAEAFPPPAPPPYCP